MPTSPSSPAKANSTPPDPLVVRSGLLASATLLLLGLGCGGLGGGADVTFDTGDALADLDPIAPNQGSGDGTPETERQAPASVVPGVANKRKGAGRKRKGGGKTSPAPADPEDEAPEEPTPAPEEPKGPRGIEQTGKRSWTVRQRLVDRWKDNPHALANVAAHGEGWQLRQVRRNEAYHLGMKNKDVILSVNGRKLKTKTQMLAAYLALKNKTEFEVVFLRNGKQMKHTYRIRG